MNESTLREVVLLKFLYLMTLFWIGEDIWKSGGRKKFK